jgi:hypothetical protein
MRWPVKQFELGRLTAPMMHVWTHHFAHFIQTYQPAHNGLAALSLVRGEFREWAQSN